MRPRCLYPFTHFEVNTPRGEVTCCCYLTRPLGNINDQSVAAIWNGEPYRRLRQEFLARGSGCECPPSCPVLQGWKDYENLDWFRDLPAASRVMRNAEHNEREIAAGTDCLQSQPRWLRFAASYRCNLRCYHCFQAEERAQGGELPDAFFAQARTLLPTLQVLFLYGGEPLLEARNLTLLEQGTKESPETRVFIVTNGTILNERVGEVLTRANLGLLAVSLDSRRAQRYAELRTPARWEETERNLQWFAQRVSGRGIYFHLGMTVNRQNMDELAEFIGFARGLGAVPDFQFAGNYRQDPVFRDRFEIRRADVPELLRQLAAAEAELLLPADAAVRRNLHTLAECARNMPRYPRLSRRLRYAWKWFCAAGRRVRGKK